MEWLMFGGSLEMKCVSMSDQPCLIRQKILIIMSTFFIQLVPIFINVVQDITISMIHTFGYVFLMLLKI